MCWGEAAVVERKLKTEKQKVKKAAAPRESQDGRKNGQG
jgi:hypothetical protein